MNESSFKTWFLLYPDGRQVGPLKEAEIIRLIELNQLPEKTKVRRMDQDFFKSIHEIPLFAKIILKNESRKPKTIKIFYKPIPQTMSKKISFTCNIR